MMAEKQSFLKKRDILIVVIVLAIAAAGMAAVHFLSPKQTTNYAVIWVGSNVYDVVDLTVDQVVEVDQGNGTVNHVEVKDGAIDMVDSTCPDQQCVYQGAMSMENYEDRILRNWIVCLPNQVTIELALTEE